MYISSDLYVKTKKVTMEYFQYETDRFAKL